jgi:hypothetical protein
MQVQFIIFGEMYGNMIFPFFTGLKMLLQQKLSCLLKTGGMLLLAKVFQLFKRRKMYSLRPDVPLEICRKAQ